jgi:hypothetical protein
LAIFALVCAYAHAQCCVGAATTMDGKDPVMPKTEADCKATKGMAGEAGVWTPTCNSAIPMCMSMKCTAKQGSTSVAALMTMCTTDALFKTALDAMPKGLMADGKTTDAKCAAASAASAAPSSKLASGALLMVSAFVSLVVASV